MNQAMAVQKSGVVHAFGAANDIGPLLKDSCIHFVEQIGRLGTRDELEIGQAAAALDAGDLRCRNSRLQTMRSRAESMQLPTGTSIPKQQKAIRAAHLLDRLRMRAFAIEHF
jgi:hypothetical protein